MLMTGFYDASDLARERIERLRREAEEQRLARGGHDYADTGSPRRPKR